MDDCWWLSNIIDDVIHVFLLLYMCDDKSLVFYDLVWCLIIFILIWVYDNKCLYLVIINICDLFIAKCAIFLL